MGLSNAKRLFQVQQPSLTVDYTSGQPASMQFTVDLGKLLPAIHVALMSSNDDVTTEELQAIVMDFQSSLMTDTENYIIDQICTIVKHLNQDELTSNSTTEDSLLKMADEEDDGDSDDTASSRKRNRHDDEDDD